jgi:hypothetical protein
MMYTSKAGNCNVLGLDMCRAKMYNLCDPLRFAFAYALWYIFTCEVRREDACAGCRNGQMVSVYAKRLRYMFAPGESIQHVLP